MSGCKDESEAERPVAFSEKISGKLFMNSCKRYRGDRPAMCERDYYAERKDHACDVQAVDVYSDKKTKKAMCALVFTADRDGYIGNAGSQCCDPVYIGAAFTG